jgi:hypothetical protein
MQTRITVDEIHAAARQLAKHENGRAALQSLAQALEHGALEIGLLDQRAFLALLGGAWMGQRETVCRILRETLQNTVAESPTAPRT